MNLFRKTHNSYSKIIGALEAAKYDEQYPFINKTKELLSIPSNTINPYIDNEFNITT